MPLTPEEIRAIAEELRPGLQGSIEQSLERKLSMLRAALPAPAPAAAPPRQEINAADLLMEMLKDARDSAREDRAALQAQLLAERAKPNPGVQSIKEALELAKEFGALGGKGDGSPWVAIVEKLLDRAEPLLEGAGNVITARAQIQLDAESARAEALKARYAADVLRYQRDLEAMQAAGAPQRAPAAALAVGGPGVASRWITCCSTDRRGSARPPWPTSSETKCRRRSASPAARPSHARAT